MESFRSSLEEALIVSYSGHSDFDHPVKSTGPDLLWSEISTRGRLDAACSLGQVPITVLLRVRD